MKRKFIKSKYKEGCIDNIKLLGIAEDILKNLATRDDKLTSAEYHEFTKAFCLMLDTAYFFLPWQERYQLIQQLQNGETTPSQVERKVFSSEGIPKPSAMKDHVFYGGKYIPKMSFDYLSSDLQDKVDLSVYSDYL